MQKPAVTSLQRIERINLSRKHLGTLYQVREAAGSIQYAWLLTVTLGNQEEPILYVTAEENAIAVNVRNINAQQAAGKPITKQQAAIATLASQLLQTFLLAIVVQRKRAKAGVSDEWMPSEQLR